MYQHRKEIMQNVFLTYLPASKFKTSVLSAHLVTPLQKETAAANADTPARVFIVPRISISKCYISANIAIF